jgi:two-component sensor histidine kinase
MGHGMTDAGGVGEQVSLRGPEGIRLRSATVQTFALALHELATNALKHGALSGTQGRLEVIWDLTDGPGGERQLRVEWRETGAAPSPHTSGSGYGRELIERALPYQLQAETSYEIGPAGLRCVIALPVSAGQGGTMSEGARGGD